MFSEVAVALDYYTEAESQLINHIDNIIIKEYGLCDTYVFVHRGGLEFRVPFKLSDDVLNRILDDCNLKLDIIKETVTSKYYGNNIVKSLQYEYCLIEKIE